jgi:ABC-2 type transport system permease protein
MPFDLRRLSEAFAVAAVVSIFLLGAGNLLSIHQARAVNPATSFRAGAAGTRAGDALVIYPIGFLPAALAYLARWAFDSQIAFFAVLGVDMLIGLVIYRIALDSAVAGAERLKEKMVNDLSAGEAPIAS